MVVVEELSPVLITEEDGSVTSIRIFQLSLNNITVEISSLGASITKILIPNYAQKDLVRDDVVLSYASPKDQYCDHNKPFFGAIVGRVANRIKDGRFQLQQKGDTIETYQLELNNGPNHLHGGVNGFCTKIWTANIVCDNNGPSVVKFTLISQDGDEGYPASIKVTATYTLVQTKCGSVKLCLNMNANLLPGETTTKTTTTTRSTPISLAQHSYFNLAGHDSPNRILDHTLQMNCSEYTPVDNTSIPTRQVEKVDNAMSFCEKKILGDALEVYAVEKASIQQALAKDMVQQIMEGKSSESIANEDGDSPYGFDHNYIIDEDSRAYRSLSEGEDDNLHLAAVLSHPPTQRSLHVLTSAPGMQL